MEGLLVPVLELMEAVLPFKEAHAAVDVRICN